jgi:hypothetical protein
MRSSVLLISVLLILAGCAGEMPATHEAGPRVEIRHEIRDLETLRFGPAQDADGASEQKPLMHARVLEAYVYDDGPDEVRHDVLAKAIPQIVVALDAYGADAPAALVRIYVVTGGDPDDAWVTSVLPPQFRAISRLSEPQRAAALKRLAWGYTSRRRVP